MILEALDSFRLRLDGQPRSVAVGDIVTVSATQGWKILGHFLGKVRQVETGPCFSCQSRRRWISIYGAVLCAECHPPADRSLVVKWIEGGL